MSVHKPPGAVELVTGGRVSVGSVGVVELVTGDSVSVGRIVTEVERPEHMPAVQPFLLSSSEALERR